MDAFGMAFHATVDKVAQLAAEMGARGPAADDTFWAWVAAALSQPPPTPSHVWLLGEGTQAPVFGAVLQAGTSVARKVMPLTLTDVLEDGANSPLAEVAHAVCAARPGTPDAYGTLVGYHGVYVARPELARQFAPVHRVQRRVDAAAPALLIVIDMELGGAGTLEDRLRAEAGLLADGTVTLPHHLAALTGAPFGTVVRDVPQVARFVSDLLQAVDDLHTRVRALHGDIKPDNILIRPRAGPNSLDRLAVMDLAGMKPTNAQGLVPWHWTMATVGYVPAPDRATPLVVPGSPPHIVPGRSILDDTYAVGCVSLDLLPGTASHRLGLPPGTGDFLDAPRPDAPPTPLALGLLRRLASRAKALPLSALVREAVALAPGDYHAQWTATVRQAFPRAPWDNRPGVSSLFDSLVANLHGFAHQGQAGRGAYAIMACAARAMYGGESAAALRAAYGPELAAAEALSREAGVVRLRELPGHEARVQQLASRLQAHPSLARRLAQLAQPDTPWAQLMPRPVPGAGSLAQGLLARAAAAAAAPPPHLPQLLGQWQQQQHQLPVQEAAPALAAPLQRAALLQGLPPILAQYVAAAGGVAAVKQAPPQEKEDNRAAGVPPPAARAPPAQQRQRRRRGRRGQHGPGPVQQAAGASGHGGEGAGAELRAAPGSRAPPKEPQHPPAAELEAAAAGSTGHGAVVARPLQAGAPLPPPTPPEEEGGAVQAAPLPAAPVEPAGEGEAAAPPDQLPPAPAAEDEEEEGPAAMAAAPALVDAPLAQEQAAAGGAAAWRVPGVWGARTGSAAARVRNAMLQCAGRSVLAALAEGAERLLRPRGLPRYT